MHQFQRGRKDDKNLHVGARAFKKEVRIRLILQKECFSEQKINKIK